MGAYRGADSDTYPWAVRRGPTESGWIHEWRGAVASLSRLWRHDGALHALPPVASRRTRERGSTIAARLGVQRGRVKCLGPVAFFSPLGVRRLSYYVNS